MQDQNIINILEFLEPFGYKHNGNITVLLNEIFPYPKDDKPKLENERSRIFSFLDGLAKADLIEFNRVQFNVLGYNTGWDEKERWMGEYGFLASIGLAGLEVLKEARKNKIEETVNKSVIDTNKSVQITNQNITDLSTTQKNLAIVSTLALALSTVYLVATYYKSDSPIQLATYKLLQKQERLLESTQKSQKGIDSSLSIMAKKFSQKVKP